MRRNKTEPTPQSYHVTFFQEKVSYWKERITNTAIFPQVSFLAADQILFDMRRAVLDWELAQTPVHVYTAKERTAPIQHRRKKQAQSDQPPRAGKYVPLEEYKPWFERDPEPPVRPLPLPRKKP